MSAFGDQNPCLIIFPFIFYAVKSHRRGINPSDEAERRWAFNAAFVGKHFGVGYSCNFGRPL